MVLGKIMETIEHTDPITGRKYVAMQDGDMLIIKGPPEGLVDSLNLPEPFATTLHNILYNRKLLTSKDLARNPNSLMGALQEAMMLDIQKLTEAYFNFEKEVLHE